MGSREQALIHGSPNGATHLSGCSYEFEVSGKLETENFDL